MTFLDYKKIECEDLGNGLTGDVRKDIDVNLCEGLAIQEVARKNSTDVVEKMIDREHKGNIHQPGGKYGGVLQAAAMGGDVDLLTLLLQRKANPNLQGGEYGTPFAAAAAYGNSAAVRVLLEYGADATVQGVGRYGSAFNSVFKALKIGEEGLQKIQHLSEQIQGILRASGGDTAVGARDMPHLKDRWQLMSNGYSWNREGEL